jgi:hypothetical protein
MSHEAESAQPQPAHLTEKDLTLWYGKKLLLVGQSDPELRAILKRLKREKSAISYLGRIIQEFSSLAPANFMINVDIQQLRSLFADQISLYMQLTPVEKRLRRQQLLLEQAQQKPQGK